MIKSSKKLAKIGKIKNDKKGQMGGGNKNCTKNILGVLSLKLEMVILSENSKLNDL